MRIDHNCRIHATLEASVSSSAFPTFPTSGLTVGYKGSIVKTNFQPVLYQTVTLNLIQTIYRCQTTLMQCYAGPTHPSHC